MDKKKLLIILSSVFGLLFVIVFIINSYVYFSTKKYIISNEDYSSIGTVDCIIVLGGGIREDQPSPILKDRLDKAIELYKLGIAPKIIMSGDHGKVEHDEVSVMKKYAMDNGVPSEDIFMDHAGFSTYDTMYRARDVFGIKKAIIVTQEYHMFRSIYIARKLGLEVYGVSAEKVKYSGRIFREFREVFARNKDVIKCILKPKPTYLGEKINIKGNGNITNDKYFEKYVEI